MAVTSTLSSRSQSRTRPARWPDYLVGALLVVVLLPAIWYATRLIQTDWTVLKARASTSAWAEGRREWFVPDWVEARNSTEAALKIMPDSPGLHDQLGVLYTMRARDSWRSVVIQQAMYNEAAKHQKASLALRPGHGWTWAGLAESLQVLQPGSPEAWHAWRQALRFAPHEKSVQMSLFNIGMHGWSKAPADVKQWMRSSYTQARPSLRKELDRVLAHYPHAAGWR